MSEITCRIVRDGNEIFSDTQRGIIPLMSILENNINVKNAVAYDKIVGKAAALLYVLMEVAVVHAEVLSKSGAEIFRNFGVEYTYKTLTDNIKNRRGTGLCPMEETVIAIEDPQTAFVRLRDKIKELQSK